MRTPVRRRLERNLPPKIAIHLPASVDKEFARAFEAKLVESTSTTWQMFLSLFQSFVAREGHGNVPLKHVEEEQLLGRWVVQQRKAWAKGRLSTYRTRQLHAQRGWGWKRVAAEWEQGFTLLQEFVQEFGTALVPRGTTHDSGFPLGEWVDQQRGLKGTTTQRALKKFLSTYWKRLETVDGWEWEPEPDRRKREDEEGFTHLRCYVFGEGHALVSGYFGGGENDSPHFCLGNFNIGRWAMRQRRRYWTHELSADEIKRLESFPFWSWEEPAAGESARLTQALLENPDLPGFQLRLPRSRITEMQELLKQVVERGREDF